MTDKCLKEHTCVNMPLVATLTVALVFLMACGVCCSTPKAAYAAYSNPSVTTVAQVQTDGSFRVVEQRSYDLDESYSALVWPVTGLTAEAELAISSVRIGQLDDAGALVGDWIALEGVPFQPGWRNLIEQTEGLTERMQLYDAQRTDSADTLDMIPLPAANTFAFDKQQNAICIFLDATDVSLLVECDYIAKSAVMVFDDAAELYWDYVSAQGDVATYDVTVTVQLPMPEGMSVIPGQTVRAWGHGPAGEVDVKADGTVTFTVPEVPEGGYAQAHVLFPASWLTNLSIKMKQAYSGTRIADAVAEEEAWTDSWSYWQINRFGLEIAVVVFAIGVLLVAMLIYALCGRERTPAALWSQLPWQGGPEGFMGQDPALMGRLLRWNHSATDDLVAELLYLEERDVIQLEVIPVADGRGGASPVCDVRVRMRAGAKDRIDSDVNRETLRLLFDEFGEGYGSVSLRDILLFAKEHPVAFAQSMQAWQRTLDAAVAAAGFFDARSKKAKRILLIGALVCLVLGAGAWFVVHDGSSALILCVSAVLIALIANYTERRTQLGCVLETQLGAFIQHAKEAALLSEKDGFSQSSEVADTPPQDACLPGGAFVYAYVAGCVDDVYCALERAGKVDRHTKEWFSPLRGRGGRVERCFAVQVAQRLSKALSKAYAR